MTYVRRKIRRKYIKFLRMGQCALGAFLEARHLPTVTLDVVPLPPPRIKPHECTRLSFHFSLVF